MSKNTHSKPKKVSTKNTFVFYLISGVVFIVVWFLILFSIGSVMESRLETKVVSAVNANDSNNARTYLNNYESKFGDFENQDIILKLNSLEVERLNELITSQDLQALILAVNLIQNSNNHPDYIRVLNELRKLSDESINKLVADLTEEELNEANEGNFKREYSGIGLVNEEILSKLKIEANRLVQIRLEEEKRLAAEKEAREREEERVRLLDMAYFPDKYIQVIESNGYLGGFGTIAIHNITLKNTGEIPYKSITLSFDYYAPNETLLQTKTYTIQDTLEPGQTRIFKEINNGFINNQAKKSNVSVITAN